MSNNTACINEYMNTNNMLSRVIHLSFNTLLEVVAYSVLNRKYIYSQPNIHKIMVNVKHFIV
jgi:hypothetical protein